MLYGIMYVFLSFSYKSRYYVFAYIIHIKCCLSDPYLVRDYYSLTKRENERRLNVVIIDEINGN